MEVQVSQLTSHIISIPSKTNEGTSPTLTWSTCGPPCSCASSVDMKPLSLIGSKQLATNMSSLKIQQNNQFQSSAYLNLTVALANNDKKPVAWTPWRGEKGTFAAGSCGDDFFRPTAASFLPRDFIIVNGIGSEWRSTINQKWHKGTHWFLDLFHSASTINNSVSLADECRTFRTNWTKHARLSTNAGTAGTNCWNPNHINNMCECGALSLVSLSCVSHLSLYGSPSDQLSVDRIQKESHKNFLWERRQSLWPAELRCSVLHSWHRNTTIT